MSSIADEDMSLRHAKAELRRATELVLRGLSQEGIKQQSSVVHLELFSLPEYQNAKSLSIFMSMPAGEILTEPIVHNAFDQGKSVFIPYLRKNNLTDGPKSVMDMVELRSREDFNQLTPDKWGIPSFNNTTIEGRRRCPIESGNKDNVVNLDLIVMPGVAFDQKLQRIGHGKGYYDYFLERYLAASEDKAMPSLVAIALEQQLLPDGHDIPTSSLDWQWMP